MRILLVIAVSGCVVEVGTIDQPIIGGETTTQAEYPTVVALEGPDDWGCTGTLIDKDWVLSAAHCVEGETTATLKIRFDDANLNDSTGGTVVSVAEIHAKSDWVDPVWDNDIVLIRLATSVTDRTPTPIAREAVPAGTMMINVGYGDSDNNGNGSGVLRKLVAPTIRCADSGESGLSDENLLCFDPTTGRASCDGDSGGPSFVMSAGTLHVAGINSGSTGNTCTTGVELYTSVAGEIAFVDMILGDGGGGGGDGDGDGSDGSGDGNGEGDSDSAAAAGCSAGDPGGLVAIASMLLLVYRRRRAYGRQT